MTTGFAGAEVDNPALIVDGKRAALRKDVYAIARHPDANVLKQAQEALKDLGAPS